MSKTARIVYFSTWADGLEPAASYLGRLPTRDLRGQVSDPALLAMARLDCDWDGECLRAFAAASENAEGLAPALVAGPRGVIEYLGDPAFDEATPWLVAIDQVPGRVAPVIGRLLQAWTRRGGRVLYWAYDEASREMACFADGVAPYLSVLIHDEQPLDETVRRALPATCRTRHLSWVANVVPFSVPFVAEPEPRIVFLGSRLGITPHREAQLAALADAFGDAFTAITDHSVPVAERDRFASIAVHVCPEGRKFATPAMSRTHTDRPFWAGCLGQVPVAEDSRAGGRLDELAAHGVILRYPHGDLEALVDACRRALELGVDERRRIYEYFNRHGTVGPIVAAEIAAASAT